MQLFPVFSKILLPCEVNNLAEACYHHTVTMRNSVSHSALAGLREDFLGSHGWTKAEQLLNLHNLIYALIAWVAQVKRG